jgi:type I restriction enzyme S subunit
MSSERVRLGELGADVKNAIVGGPFGSNLVSKDYVASGVPVIRGQNMGERWVGGEFVYVSEQKATSLSANKARPGDLVFTQRGTLGQVSLVPQLPFPEYVVSQSQMKVTLDPKRVDANFLYYVFKSPEQLEYIKNTAIQTGVPHTNLGILRNTPINLPRLLEQREIASMLGALDDRITLLRETNTTLEAIAQALFKSWFVNFDPVRAKSEGRAPEGMDEATAALFPDGFEESALGFVPEGWTVGCIEDLCSVVTNGGTPSRNKPVFWDGGTIPWFKTGEFKDGFLLKPSEFITQVAVSGSSVKLLPKDAVLMAIYAAPTVGRLGVLTEPATFNQACTGMVASDVVGPWFLYWTLFNGRDWFNSRANGAAQQNISQAIVAAYRVVIPAQNVLDAFNRVVATVHDSIRLNSERVLALSEMRDTLLPRLISGQLRLPEAETLLEVACA